MQILFSFKTDRPLSLPIQYNRILQGFIYNCIDEELASFLHDGGYSVNNRAFKLFVFSRLLGRFHIDKQKETINFGEEFSLWVASPLEFFCRSICQHMLNGHSLRLGSAQIMEVQTEVKKPAVERGSIVVNSRSPVTAYSTFERPQGGKYTCYFQPGEADFDRLATANLQKKVAAFSREPLTEGEVQVRPLRAPKLNIIKYKGIVIKGYTGRYRLSGPPQLLQMALDAGLGSKNSQGFGFLSLS